MSEAKEALKLIVATEVARRKECGGNLNDNGVYEARLAPIVAALERNTTYAPETLAKKFCEAVRAVETDIAAVEANVPSDFLDPLQEHGHYQEMPDAIAAVGLVYDFMNNKAHLAPSRLPLQVEGVERIFFNTVAEVVDFFGSFTRYNTHDLVLRMSTTRQYVIDIAVKAAGDAD